MELGQLAADRDGARRESTRGEHAQRRCQPARGLERDQRLARVAQAAPRARARLRGRKPTKQPALARQAGGDERGRDRARARQHLDRDARRRGMPARARSRDPRSAACPRRRRARRRRPRGSARAAGSCGRASLCSWKLTSAPPRSAVASSSTACAPVSSQATTSASPSARARAASHPRGCRSASGRPPAARRSLAREPSGKYRVATDVPPTTNEPPQYTRYRAGRRLLRRTARARGWRIAITPARHAAQRSRWRRLRTSWSRRKRVAARRCSRSLLGWLALSLALFLISSHFERTPLAKRRLARARPGRLPAHVRQQHPRARLRPPPEGQQGTGRRNDRLRALGHDHADPHRRRARRAPVDPARHRRRNPGHGLQKINAAHEFGGPALSVSVIKHWLGIPINHVVEVNFENFPQLIDAMGGVTYTGGCIISRSTAASADGGYTLRLSPARTTSTASRRSRWRARARTCARPTRPTSSARNTSRRCSPT